MQQEYEKNALPVQKWDKIRKGAQKEENKMQEQGITYIETEHIHPHPENPRKDLGDLTELAQSLEKNGVMQNLTVVPIEGEPGEYYAIIGNRRHAAAQLAGVEKLPCRVAEGMERREQVAIMLEENMQRSDLKIHEQAQGFQLMLDLGETVNSIAEKTGFCKETVRQRLKIAKLDQKVLKEKEEDDGFQLRIKDLMELEKVKDAKTRDKILEDAKNSGEIAWRVQYALDEEKRAANKETIAAKLEAMGIQKAPKGAEKEQWVGKWNTLKQISLEDDPPEKISIKETEDAFYVRWYNNIHIIKKREEKQETQEDIQRKEWERKRGEIDEKLGGMIGRARRLIADIISGEIDAEGNWKGAQEEIWGALVELKVIVSGDVMSKFLFGKERYMCTGEEMEEADEKFRRLDVTRQMLVNMYKGILRAWPTYDWNCRFDDEKAKKIKKIFAPLERYGWFFTNEEKKLLDGTHELYEKEERREQRND